jgi:hypothetical protein
MGFENKKYFINLQRLICEGLKTDDLNKKSALYLVNELKNCYIKMVDEAETQFDFIIIKIAEGCLEDLEELLNYYD